MVDLETAAKALDTEFYSYDLNERLTVREWLGRLLSTLWEEGEGFSGKRPLGDSGWEEHPVGGLIEAGVIKGRITKEIEVGRPDYTEVQDYDWREYRKLIAECISIMSGKHD